MYGATGDEVKERLWEETMKELEFADVATVIRDMAS
jgi:hypothetical protein